MRIKEGTCFAGRTLEIEHGLLKLAVTLDVGPRIIYLSYANGPNLLFEDSKRQIKKDVQAVFGEGETWYIYGGHRIWASPEEEKTYVPDNDVVTYKVENNEVTFIPKEWKVVGLQSALKLTFLSSNSLKIDMSLKNTGEDKRLSLWGLTVFLPGGEFTAKLSKKDTGYLPNRNLVFWPYSSLNDSRFSVLNDTIVLKSDKSNKNPFKVGFFTDVGSVSYAIGNCLFTKTVSLKNGNYPDMNCNVETYTNNLIHEVETLSPLVTLKKEEILNHEEIWTLAEFNGK